MSGFIGISIGILVGIITARNGLNVSEITKGNWKPFLGIVGIMFIYWIGVLVGKLDK